MNPQKPQPNQGLITLDFDMQTPPGARIYPTNFGVRIQFPITLRQSVLDWLKTETARFESSHLEPEEMETCPKCGGTVQLINNIPTVCSLCSGRGAVPTSVAKAYKESLPTNSIEAMVAQLELEQKPRPSVPANKFAGQSENR